MYRHITDIMYIHNNPFGTYGKIDAMLLTNARICTFADETPYGLIENGAVALQDEFIEWVGDFSNLPECYAGHERIDVGGNVVTPGLIDCHTHVVFGGNRASEFELRLNGATYEEVALAGGGIVSTVLATRKASEDELLIDALNRVDVLISEGVTTLEVKSGYGLDEDTELKMLRVAKRLAEVRDIRIKTSFLGAHAIPPEFSDEADAYIDTLCIPTLRLAHKENLVDAVDGFCEGIAFSPEQIERLFREASSLNIPVKLHAEQLSDLGGAKLAARFDALSADHLEYLQHDGVEAMARSGTVAVLLPGAFYTLRETQLPPVQLLRDHSVPIAIATDCNPGSSPLTSILLAMNMGCTLFALTPEEALRGTTKNAAKALGFQQAGSIEAGQYADLCIWDIENPAELAYRFGYNPLRQRIFAGKPA